jgi:hypothetical protein
MNQAIAKELEILWSDFGENDVDTKLKAFACLKAAATKNDLPQLVDALKSERNDFWVRELLSEPISDLGGIDYLPELFDALQKNYDDGHDNDGFHHHLMEIALAESAKCKQKLLELMATDVFEHKEAAQWLLGFCE